MTGRNEPGWPGPALACSVVIIKRRGPFAPGRPGAADRPQGPKQQPRAGARASPSTPTGARSSTTTLIGTEEGSVVRRLGRHRVPRLPAPARRLRGLDAARRRGRLPQGRRPDRRPWPTSSPAPACVEAGVGLRRAVLLAAARGRARTAAGRPTSARADFADVARRNVEAFFGGPHPAWSLTIADLPAAPGRPPPRCRCAGRRRRTPPGRSTGSCLDMLAPWDVLGPRSVARRQSGALARPWRPHLLLRRDHHPAVPRGRGAARARRLHRARTRGSRWCAAGTSRVWRSGPSTGWSGTPASS